MQRNQGECIFSSEWDKMAQRTYYANFGEIPFGDITKPETKQWIPDKFDILCGGFPCQPFSIAGVSKKNSLGRMARNVVVYIAFRMGVSLDRLALAYRYESNVKGEIDGPARP